MSFHRFLARHPALRDALLWALPAIAFGGVLRLMMLHYSPYAYWGSDSYSYYEFSHQFFNDYSISLNEKRRIFYPLLMALISALPGAPLQWVAWLQHGFGLLTLVPMAYVVRKTLFFWKWWTIPVTVLYAGMPVILWYEHELLGETVFFALIVWAYAGWVAWANEPQRARAARLWWLFFVPFTLLIITKPSGRFFWPGLLCGLALLAAWRRLRPLQWAGIGALMLVTLSLGSAKQGKWLLYVAAFPLTQLDTPLYADYKAEIMDMVEARRNQIDYYYYQDDEPFQFTRNPVDYPERKLWAAEDEKSRADIYMALALEGIKAEPLGFLYLGLQRVVFSANPSSFRELRFEADYLPSRFRSHYDRANDRLRRKKRSPISLALGLPSRTPLPPYEELAKAFSPAPDSFSVRAVNSWVGGYQAVAHFVSAPKRAKLSEARPTVLGYWLLLAILLSFTPHYRATTGVWTLAALGYLAGVFLVSQMNARYFAPVWPVFIPLLALPADVICRALWSRKARETSPSLPIDKEVTRH